IGIEKRDAMHLVFSDDDLLRMRLLREAFNPRELLNPGKVLPTGKRCVEAKAGMLEPPAEDGP
ncbi:MAG: FAD-binding oxidoreductase, partial [Planctomycetes bacterium]|nr:FAD-binding oxidoreductase [Planctomycetota bacterium]